MDKLQLSLSRDELFELVSALESEIIRYDENVNHWEKKFESLCVTCDGYRDLKIRYGEDVKYWKKKLESLCVICDRARELKFKSFGVDLKKM